MICFRCFICKYMWLQNNSIMQMRLKFLGAKSTSIRDCVGRSVRPSVRRSVRPSRCAITWKNNSYVSIDSKRGGRGNWLRRDSITARPSHLGIRRSPCFIMALIVFYSNHRYYISCFYNKKKIRQVHTAPYRPVQAHTGRCIWVQAHICFYGFSDYKIFFSFILFRKNIFFLSTLYFVLPMRWWEEQFFSILSLGIWRMSRKSSIRGKED
jgi:hypothetical protein